MRRRASIAGFALVELMVAIVVLAVGVLGAVGVAVQATRRLNEAAVREAALMAATVVLDSLVAHPAPAAGSRRVDGFPTEWTTTPEAGGLRIDVVVTYAADGGSRRIVLGGHHAPAPPRLEEAP